jgi:hypothetical protein
MSTVVIEINDAGLVVADASGVLAVEPGYAYVDASAIVTGREAYANARLHPRQSSNRFWNVLSVAPNTAGIDGIGSAAELAYAQLSSLWSTHGGADRDCVFVVPDHYGREQLGVLLGLAQESSIDVRAMVTASVAAAETPYPDAQLLHIDAGLYRISATQLEQSEDVAAAEEQSLENVGIATVTDQLAKRVAELFVLATRFDPFHSATSEQLVYDRLSDWLAELDGQASAIKLSLPHGGEALEVEVSRDQLMGTLAGFHRAFVQFVAQCREPGAPLVVQLTDRLAAVPGVIAALERLDDSTVVALERASGPISVARNANTLGASGGGIRLLKRLPWRRAAVTTSVRPRAETPTAPDSGERDAASEVELPSHIVYRGIAYGVDAQGLLIGREQSPERRTIVLNGGLSGVSRAHCELVRRDGELKLIDMSRFGTFVNEKRISGETALHPADVIRIGSPGEQLQVIRVEQDHGA